MLRNGLMPAKSGTGNQWVLISRNFLDIPAVQSFTGMTDTLQVTIYFGHQPEGPGGCGVHRLRQEFGRHDHHAEIRRWNESCSRRLGPLRLHRPSSDRATSSFMISDVPP